MEPNIPLVGAVGTFHRQEVYLSCRIEIYLCCRVEVLFIILSRNLVPMDQPVKETGDLMANVHLWYNVVNLYKTIGQ